MFRFRFIFTYKKLQLYLVFFFLSFLVIVVSRDTVFSWYNKELHFVSPQNKTQPVQGLQLLCCVAKESPSATQRKKVCTYLTTKGKMWSSFTVKTETQPTMSVLCGSLHRLLVLSYASCSKQSVWNSLFFSLCRVFSMLLYNVPTWNKNLSESQSVDTVSIYQLHDIGDVDSALSEKQTDWMVFK